MEEKRRMERDYLMGLLVEVEEVDGKSVVRSFQMKDF